MAALARRRPPPPPLRVLVGSAPGAGKTTLCKRVAGRLQAVLPSGSVDGFLSREVHDARGHKIGYELYSLDEAVCETLASSEGPESGAMVARYHVYTSALDRVALPAIERVLEAAAAAATPGSAPCGASPAHVCIVDDIGSMTCRSDAFAARARELLESPDPCLHVLAAVGAGGAGLVADCRRIRGVTTVVIDADNREATLDSLTARFLSAAVRESNGDAGSCASGDAEGEEEGEEDDDDVAADDFTVFDRWGGDRRGLGVRRGMYSPEAAPSSSRAAAAAAEAPPASHVTAPALAPAAAASPPRPRGEVAEEASGPPPSPAPRTGPRQAGGGHACQGGPGVVEWLAKIDHFLLAAYGVAIQSRFRCATEVVDAYAARGGGDVLSERFFEDFGVKKLGHKRLFEKWFREEGRGARAAAAGAEWA